MVVRAGSGEGGLSGRTQKSWAAAAVDLSAWLWGLHPGLQCWWHLLHPLEFLDLPIVWHQGTGLSK